MEVDNVEEKKLNTNIDENENEINIDSTDIKITNEENKVEKNDIQDKSEEKSKENIDADSSNKVRILTYNIFMRPPPVHSFESDFKEDRIKLICKQFFHNYDIIAFQECFSFGSTRIDKIREKAKKHGITYFSNSKKKHSWNIGIDGGLCLLSRFPVIKKKMY